MKQAALLLFTFVFTHLTFAQTNILQEGNECFKKGDYECAISKYKVVINMRDERQKKIAGDNLKQAEKCLEFRRAADAAYNNKNYFKANEYYQSLLNENSKDDFAKAQLKEIKFLSISLSVSKKVLLFSKSGGTENIFVNTDGDSFSIGKLPTWCSVQKFEKYLTFICNENLSGFERSDSFLVTAGKKTEIINILQTKEQQITLSVSKENLFFSGAGESERVSVNTNASTYTIKLLPSWCSIQKHRGYFNIKCLPNKTIYSRSDYFTIEAEGQISRISIYQTGNELTAEKNNYSSKRKNNQKQRTREIYNYGGGSSFSSFGIQSGTIAKFGLLYEKGGGKRVGFHMSLRSSLTNNNEIISGNILKNKNEIELGPNVRLYKQLHLNIGIGLGYYDRLLNNDYIGKIYTEKTSYLVFTLGAMYRINKRININSGISFMDIQKDFYKPEIVFGLSYNFKK